MKHAQHASIIREILQTSDRRQKDGQRDSQDKGRQSLHPDGFE